MLQRTTAGGLPVVRPLGRRFARCPPPRPVFCPLPGSLTSVHCLRTLARRSAHFSGIPPGILLISRPSPRNSAHCLRPSPPAFCLLPSAISPGILPIASGHPIIGLLPLHHQSTTSPFEGGHRGLLLALLSNRCFSNSRTFFIHLRAGACSRRLCSAGAEETISQHCTNSP